jgi:two-component system, sensor histidine kinase YesM
MLLINSIIPILIITFIAVTNYSLLLNKAIISFTSALINNYKDETDDSLAEIKRVSLTLIFQQTSEENNVLRILRKQLQQNVQTNNFKLLSATRKINLTIESFLYSHNYINGIYFFLNNGAVFSASKNYELRYNYHPEGSLWYQETLAAKGKLISSEVKVHDFLLTSEPTILFSSVIYDPDTAKQLGVLLIDCNLDIFSNIIKNPAPNQATVFLLNQQGKLLNTSGKTSINKNLQTSFMQKITRQPNGIFLDPSHNNYVLFETLSEQKWKIVAEFPVEKLRYKFKRTIDFSIFFIIASIILSLFAAILFSDYFSKPIIRLANLMKISHDTQNLIINEQYRNRRDEIGALYQYFESLIDRINNLIKDKYQTQLIVMDTEMKALESQINSHFLYNTLESINSIAEIEGVEKITVMTKALGDMFRYSIKTDSELVSLAEELKHIQNYLVIQKIRYDDKIELDLNIEPDLLNCKILKLILQPIVENAICHGLESKKNTEKVKVKAYLEQDQICFQISDNGVGIPPQQLKKIRATLSEKPEFEGLGHRNKRGIGIVNVHARIQLYYGQNYGLTISSKLNEGTCIQIIIPVLQ